MPAVPVWPGCHPYDPVPVQFSCDAGDGRDRLAHHEWIAPDASDPRPELVRRIAAACRGARAIVAYNASFETRCLRLIGAALPQLRGSIEDICSRIRDALPVVRDHVYHPDFGGGFGLKTVLPALVPELSYAGLEIAEGNVASVHLARLLFEPDRMTGEEAERLRADLLRYCALDTLGLARLLARLRELA